MARPPTSAPTTSRAVQGGHRAAISTPLPAASTGAAALRKGDLRSPTSPRVPALGPKQTRALKRVVGLTPRHSASPQDRLTSHSRQEPPPRRLRFSLAGASRSMAMSVVEPVCNRSRCSVLRSRVEDGHTCEGESHAEETDVRGRDTRPGATATVVFAQRQGRIRRQRKTYLPDTPKRRFDLPKNWRSWVYVGSPLTPTP